MAKILIFLILATFPLGQLTRLPLGIPEVNIYLQDLLVGGLVIIWLGRHFIRKTSLTKPPLTKQILLFLSTAALSLIVNLPRLTFQEALVASFYLLRWLFYAGIYFVIFDISIYQYINILKWGLIWAGVGTAVFGLVQYFLYPDLGNLAYLGWDPHRYRIFGTFFDPGFLGMILVLTLILIIDYLVRAGGHEFFQPDDGALRSPRQAGGAPRAPIISKMSKVIARRPLFAIYYLLFISCYLALALTYSRSSYLAYLGGMGVIAWIKKSAKFFLVVILVGILTVLLLPRPPGSEGVRLEREESVWGRVRNWRQSLIITKDNPILGVGFNTYRYAQKQYGFLSEENWQKSHAGAGADSSLLFVLATTGILGFLAYIWLLYHILIYNVRDAVVFPSTVALFVHSWFLNSLFYPWIMLWMWILIGIRNEIPRLRSG